MIRKKKIKRILYSLLIAFLLFVLTLATIILYPQPLFANKVEYRQFNVYSNEKIGHEIESVLDSVLSLVRKSELYDSACKVDLFLAYNTFFNKIDDNVLGYGPAARTTDNNLVFKVRVDINKNLAYPVFPKPCEVSFTYLIGHEMVHCLQAHKYGIREFNPFKHPPLWKLEGYPEYVARQKFSEPTENLQKEIERFIERKRKQTDFRFLTEDNGCETPEYYYKGRLMTEYLMNVRHLTYDQLLRDKRAEEEVYSEMMEWATGK